ncbi:MAG TPA: acetate uptake transporter [Actinospica sp.]|nr:acetate uptake transporter [Actinospica sp.]
MSTESAPLATTADPAPLGLFGFGFTTLMLSVVNADLLKETGTGVLVLSLALLFGGGAQFVAGLWEFRRANTFGATAHCSYGAFWVVVWWFTEHAPTTDVHNAMALFFLGWAILTALFTIASAKVAHAVFAVFFFLTLTFLFLALGQWQNTLPGPGTLTEVAGWLGIVTGLLAWYAGGAVVINATYKRELLPLNLKK